MLEDGGEVDNVFRNNLGAFTKKVSTLISSDETDDEPSTFWITNPQVRTHKVMVSYIRGWFVLPFL
jgi:hypothetical protein